MGSVKRSRIMAGDQPTAVGSHGATRSLPRWFVACCGCCLKLRSDPTGMVRFLHRLAQRIREQYLYSSWPGIPVAAHSACSKLNVNSQVKVSYVPPSRNSP